MMFHVKLSIRSNFPLCNHQFTKSFYFQGLKVSGKQDVLEMMHRENVERGESKYATLRKVFCLFFKCAFKALTWYRS